MALKLEWELRFGDYLLLLLVLFSRTGIAKNSSKDTSLVTLILILIGLFLSFSAVVMKFLKFNVLKVRLIKIITWKIFFVLCSSEVFEGFKKLHTFFEC